MNDQDREPMDTVCDVCGEETDDAYDCQDCGSVFCTECGDSYKGVCEKCLDAFDEEPEQ